MSGKVAELALPRSGGGGIGRPRKGNPMEGRVRGISLATPHKVLREHSSMYNSWKRGDISHEAMKIANTSLRDHLEMLYKADVEPRVGELEEKLRLLAEARP